MHRGEGLSVWGANEGVCVGDGGDLICQAAEIGGSVRWRKGVAPSEGRELVSGGRKEG